MAGHVSVLLNEVLEILALQSGQVVADGTLGRAGHAIEILKRTAPDGKLIGLDKDPEAVREAGDRLAEYGKRAVIVQADFRELPRVLAETGIGRVDAILLDLGVSSPQIEDAGRGFSFLQEGPLDMRMDPRQELTAEEIVNQYPEEDIRQILWDYGEERLARQIARRIAEERRSRPIRTTKALENVVFHAVPKSYRYGRIHPATRTFQALRIAVNGELEALTQFLKEAPDCLKDGGRLAVISFHSLEDRIVKNAFRELGKNKMGMILTKKPMVPAEGETQSNPRSRSAKLRAFQRAQRSQP